MFWRLPKEECRLVNLRLQELMRLANAKRAYFEKRALHSLQTTMVILNATIITVPITLKADNITSVRTLSRVVSHQKWST